MFNSLKSALVHISFFNLMSRARLPNWAIMHSEEAKRISNIILKDENQIIKMIQPCHLFPLNRQEGGVRSLNYITKMGSSATFIDVCSFPMKIAKTEY